MIPITKLQIHTIQNCLFMAASSQYDAKWNFKLRQMLINENKDF